MKLSWPILRYFLSVEIEENYGNLVMTTGPCTRFNLTLQVNEQDHNKNYLCESQ
jgi:hypothetical protein